MTLLNYTVLTACVVAIAAGQIMFKMTARTAATSGELRDLLLSPTLAIALLIYGAATLGWVWQLRSVDLTRAYPLMALSFVIVPLASMALLGEPVSLRYWAGVGLIIVGILLTVL